MHQIDTPTAVAGEFDDSGPPTPVTRLNASWFNTVQRELQNLVEGMGGVLDVGDDAQVVSAVLKAAAQGAVGNVLINTDFRFWQRRGTGALAATNTLGFHGPDRWLFKSGNAGDTLQLSRIILSSALEISPSGSFTVIRWNKSVAGGTGEVQMLQRVETAQTLQARPVVVAWDARKAGGSDLGIVSVELVQFFGTGGSSSVITSLTPSAGTTIDSNWRRLLFKGTLPSTVGKTINDPNYVELRIKFAENVASDVYMTAFTFSRGTADPGFFQRPAAQELALCQRYFEKSQRVDVRPDAGAGTAGSQLGIWDTGWDGGADVRTLRTRLAVEKYGSSGAEAQTWYSTADGAADTLIEDGVTARSVTSSGNDRTYVVQPTLTAPPAGGTVHTYAGRWTVRAEIGTET